ncbi:hypothetical protein F5Y16DRAFT_406511 [Xylariaceae sp. FL0255]|nr:hypothetical protein F5Y16DRAFT_406511 [Xylariaceae sp. FL0255]
MEEKLPAFSKILQRAIVISGFAYIDKTWLLGKSDLGDYSALDLDSSNFSFLADGSRNPNFEDDYVSAIIQEMDKKKIILTSTHECIRNRLKALDRETMIPFFRNNWDNLFTHFLKEKGYEIIFLSPKQHLKDITFDIVGRFEVLPPPHISTDVRKPEVENRVTLCKCVNGIVCIRVTPEHA